MTLKEFVKTLADRIARLEQSGGGGDVTKAYVDEQDTKLGNRISTLNTKVNTIKRDDIDPLTESVGTLQTDVGTLQGSMTTAQDDISSLQGDVQTLTDTMPTKTSDLENDSGFITSSALPTKTSELTNDSGFITANDTVANATHSTSSDSADVSTKAINDGNGNNIANQFASFEKFVTFQFVTNADVSFDAKGIRGLAITMPYNNYTLVNGFFVNYNNSVVNNFVVIGRQQWYSNQFLNVMNMSSSALTLPSGTTITCLAKVG